MQLKQGSYKGHGINHDQEEFEGKFEVVQLPGTNTKQLRYLANRMSDGTKVHEEVGLLTENEDGKVELHVHMEELPCVTVHAVKAQSDDRWVFEYHGSGRIAGFSSELVFEFEGETFKYLHRWALNDKVSDKSWCLLEPVG